LVVAVSETEKSKRGEESSVEIQYKQTSKINDRWARKVKTCLLFLALSNLTYSYSYMTYKTNLAMF
jgi:hypothetical protein